MYAKQIKKYRELRKLSQAELSKLCGWGPGYSRLANYEQGSREPNYDDMEKLAKNLKVHAAVLIFGDRFLSISNIEYDDSHIADEATSMIQIPVIDWELAREGKDVWKLIKQENKKMDVLYYPPQLTSTPGKFLLALTIKDNSMISPSPFEKSFHPGEKVIYDPDAKPIDKKLVIAAIPGEKEVVFREYIFGAGTGYLKPFNPEYKMIQVTPGTEIVGVVVGYAGSTE